MLIKIPNREIFIDPQRIIELSLRMPDDKFDGFRLFLKLDAIHESKTVFVDFDTEAEAQDFMKKCVKFVNKQTQPSGATPIGQWGPLSWPLVSEAVIIRATLAGKRPLPCMAKKTGPLEVTMEYLDDLMGAEAEDLLTGFRGIITAYCVYATGCSQLLIQPAMKKTDKEYPNGVWIDEDRMKILKARTTRYENFRKVDKKSDGFDIPAPVK